MDEGQQFGTNNQYTLTDFTCFYYQYNADHRLTYESVYGNLRSTSYEYFEGTNEQTDTNAWTRKTIETRSDRSIYTVYTNFLGSTIFSELYDPNAPAGQQHTYHYYQYDANGHITLDAESEAISGYSQGQDYHLTISAADHGLVNKYTYYTASDPQATETTVAGVSYRTAGGVTDYLKLAQVSDGINGTAVTVHEYSYYKHTANGQTVYALASQKDYVDGSQSVTTSYSPDWYHGTTNLRTNTTTLPAVSPQQNGSDRRPRGSLPPIHQRCACC